MKRESTIFDEINQKRACASRARLFKIEMAFAKFA